MTDLRISRRSALMAMGAISAWAASPLRAAVKSASKLANSHFIDELVSRMTLEEKAGQLTLMPSAWGGSQAAQLNPPGDGQGLRRTDRGRAWRAS